MRIPCISRLVWPVVCVFFWTYAAPPMAALAVPTDGYAVVDDAPAAVAPAAQPVAMRASAYPTAQLTAPPNDPTALLNPAGDAAVQTQAGTINATVGGNDFTTINRPVQGFQMNGAGGFTGLLSRVVPVAKMDNIVGQYSAGPYYLTGVPILPGSEVITVNGCKRTRSTDYTLDTTTGALVFTGTQFYGPNDHINAQYQTLANSDGCGQLTALRSSAPVGGGLSLGVSHVGFTGVQPLAIDHQVDGLDMTYQPDAHLALNLQTAQSTGLRVAPDTPAQPVVGEALLLQAGVPLLAQSWHTARAPLQPGTAVLYTPTRTLIRDLDYVLDEQAGTVRLVNPAAVLTGQTLSINYIAAAQHTTLSGDAALSAAATYHSSQLNVQAHYRNVDSGFNPFDGAGAAQAGQSADWSASFAPAPALTLSTTGTNSQTPGVAGTAENRGYTLDVHPKGLPSLALTHSTNDLTGSGDTSTNDALTSSWTKSGFTAGVTLNRGTTTGEGASSATNNATANLQYQPTDRVNASVNVTRSDGTNSSPGFAAHSTGSGVGATALYKPAKNLALNVNAQQSTNATANALDPQCSPTLTSGQYGGGVTWTPIRHLDVGIATQLQQDRTSYPAGDPLLPVLTPNTATQTRTNTVTMNYAPNVHAQVGASLAQNSTTTNTGGVLTTGAGQNMQVTVLLHPSNRLTVNGLIADTTNNPSLSANTGTLPGLRTRTASAGAGWQASKSLSLNTTYSTNRYQDTTYGINAATTTALDAGWHPGGGANGVTGYALHQTTQTPCGGTTRQSMFGGSVQVAPRPHTTLGVGVQRIYGGSDDAVNQLLQTEGQTRRAQLIGTPPPALQNVIPPILPGRSLTVVDGVVGYKLNAKHDLTLTGESITGRGDAGDIHRTSVGVGWHYAAGKRLAFSLDGSLIQSHDPSTDGLTVHSHEVDATVSWKF